MPLLGHPRTLGEAFHITSDDVLTWNQIARDPGGRGRRQRADIVHVPSDAIAAADAGLGRRAARRQGALDGVRQLANCAVSCPATAPSIPFEQGAREIVAWYDEDPARQRADMRLDAVMDKLVETYRL